jgi:ubiquinone/menaquinone biosynthesis C-methylase UbiE
LVSVKDQEHKNYLELQLNRTLQRKEQNSSDRAKYLLKKLIEKTNCSTELKILSVGCRNKYEIRAIHETGFNNVTGIDLYSEDKSILVMDMHGMTFEDNSFDIIFSCHSLEHAQDYKKVISEFVRVAKDGSIFVIEVPVNYETTVADLWDFESLGNLKNIFQKHIKQILYEELEKKAENSSSGTDVIRMIFTIAKTSVDGENTIGKT